MSVERLLREVFRIVLWVLIWPFLAALGAAVAAAWALRIGREILKLPAVTAASLSCPNGHANAVISRWECARCGGEFLGWVGRCEVCGDEDVDWFPCEVCNLAIPLPWRRR